MSEAKRSLIKRIYEDGDNHVPGAAEFGDAYLKYPGSALASLQHALSLNLVYNENVAAEIMTLCLKSNE